MALINCRECEKEISDQAASCPGCGAPIITATPLASEHVENLTKEVKMLGRTAEYRAGHELGEGVSSGLYWLAENKYMALFWVWQACIIGIFILGRSLGITEETVAPDVYGWFVLGAFFGPLILVGLFRKPIQKFVPPVLTTIVSFGLTALYVAFVGGLLYIAFRMLAG